MRRQEVRGHVPKGGCGGGMAGSRPDGEGEPASWCGWRALGSRGGLGWGRLRPSAGSRKQLAFPLGEGKTLEAPDDGT